MKCGNEKPHLHLFLFLLQLLYFRNKRTRSLLLGVHPKRAACRFHNVSETSSSWAELRPFMENIFEKYL